MNKILPNGDNGSGCAGHLVGKGNFSHVYKVNIEGRDYAVKQLQRDAQNISFSQLENVLNEVQILSKTEHPRIVKLYEKYRTQKFYHIFLEYCNGGDLS